MPNAFWKSIATGLTKGAVWAAGHPDEIIAIVSAISNAKAEADAKKNPPDNTPSTGTPLH